MKYQLLQIRQGVETILLDTDSKNEIRKHYHWYGLCRIRVEGRMLLIFQAEDWLNNLPIRDYRVKRYNEHLERPVIQKDKDGNVIARYHSIAEAAKATGNRSANNVMRACKTGHATRSGLWFEYA